ncbi:MAG: IMS domain-containing protein [Cyanobacterium sp.]
MQELFCDNSNQKITLVKQIANSGEGQVWTTNWSRLVAKLYHDPSPEKFAKLKVMMKNKPEDPNQDQNHTSFSFPHSLIKDRQGKFLGFLMPRIEEALELIDVYNPKRRKLKKLEIDWHFLHYTALNIVSIINAIHKAGYVVGDIKPQNILVNSQAVPSFIDVDSFQVKDRTNGKLYPCPVGTDGYTPPELIGVDLLRVEQKTYHDNFRLGILIYQLLFSYHPFGLGKWVGSGDKPEQNDLIKRGIWLESKNRLLVHNHNTIPLHIIHPSLQKCFLRCFNEGHQQPHLRPTATEWLHSLREAANKLQICSAVESHIYSSTNGNCCWCQRKLKLGNDIFKLPDGVKSTSETRVSIKVPKKNKSNVPVTTQLSSNHSSFQQPITQPTLKANDDSKTKRVIGAVIGILILLGLLLMNDPSRSPVRNTRTTNSPQRTVFSQQVAVNIIQGWLNAKSQIFAPPYDKNLASSFLTGTQYHNSVNRSDGEESSIDWLRNRNAYYTYSNQSVDGVEYFILDGNVAIIDALITENYTLYNARGGIDTDSSGYTQRLIRYEFSLINGQWKISDYNTLEVKWSR